jgi:biotin operon repressor
VIVDVLRAAARFQENAAEDFARIRDHLNPLLEHAPHRRPPPPLREAERHPERALTRRTDGRHRRHVRRPRRRLPDHPSDNGARLLGVDVEARDFAAPDRLGLAIVGDGSGKHGGFTYADTATLVVDATAAGHEDLVALTLDLLADERWRSGDELADELGKGRRAIEDAIEDDTKARARDDLGPRVARWNRDGRELPAKPDGKPWAWNARPWGSTEMLKKGSVGSQPSQPSLLDEGRSKGSVPSKEGDRATEPFENARPRPTEPIAGEPAEGA